jgi:hypothetical protein
MESIGVVMSGQVYIGVDPGVSGAVAVVGDGKPRVYDMPVMIRLRYRRGKKAKVKYEKKRIA